ncbi:MAG: hypothetical protein FWH33_07125 [Oscillospiraceae bacterium]|nr:hypothetical protein [Oscillospiraceae bacterium]
MDHNNRTYLFAAIALLMNLLVMLSACSTTHSVQNQDNSVANVSDFPASTAYYVNSNAETHAYVFAEEDSKQKNGHLQGESDCVADGCSSDTIEDISNDLSDSITHDMYIGPAKDDYAAYDTENLLFENLPEIIQSASDYYLFNSFIYLSGISRVIHTAGGDLNCDGYNDLAVVVEYLDANNNYLRYDDDCFGKRELFILLGADDNCYDISLKSETIMRDRWTGGAHFSDPLNAVYIKDNQLVIIHVTGSSWRSSYEMYFSYINESLILSKVRNVNFHTFSFPGEEIIFNFIEHKAELFSWRESGEPIHDLLYTRTLPDITFMFDSVCCYDIEQYVTIPHIPKILGAHDFHDYNWIENEPYDLSISASDALDMVMAEHFPSFTKVQLILTQENIDNYFKLLLYEVPDYYYIGDSGTLEYLRLDVIYHEGPPVDTSHIIVYRGNEDKYAYDFFRIPATGASVGEDTA